VEEGGRDVANRVPEIMDKFAHRLPQYNETLRDEVSRQANATDAILEGTPIEESRKKDNIITLGSGNHGGVSLSKNNTQVKSTGNAKVTRQVICGSDPNTSDSLVTFIGINFISSTEIATRNNASCLVHVKKGHASFVGCTFTKDSGDPMNSNDTDFANFVMIEEGAKAVFNGCTFSGVMTQTGDVVRNHSNNNPADCQVAFSINTTGQTNSNCTNTGVLT